MALSDKRERFVAEYLIDLNSTQAALRAGYSPKTAASQGNRLLNNVEIMAAIRAGQQDRSKRTQVTIDGVVTELAQIGFFDPADLSKLNAASGPADIAKLPRRVRAAITGWSWDRSGNFTIKLADKLAALEKLAKHLNMFDGEPAAPSVTVNLPFDGWSIDRVQPDPD